MVPHLDLGISCELSVRGSAIQGWRGGGTSGSVGGLCMSSAADLHHGEFLWRILCIFRVGTGRVDGDGGVRSGCLTRRKKVFERHCAWRARCLTNW